MAKIEPRLTAAPAPVKPVQESPKPAAQAPASPAPGDRLVVSSGAKTAERMRAFNREVEALLEFSPRTTAQATAWLKKGRTLQEGGAPSLKNGDLKSLPLKERQQYIINMRRLEHLSADGPSVLRFFTGE